MFYAHPLQGPKLQRSNIWPQNYTNIYNVHKSSPWSWNKYYEKLKLKKKKKKKKSFNSDGRGNKQKYVCFIQRKENYLEGHMKGIW